ncbi:MAG: hypothetical protein M1299_07570 [Firmicutes bacterium]|nr:hypothetical protein [Bacillota bacterium]
MDKELLFLVGSGVVVLFISFIKPDYALALTIGSTFFSQPRPQVFGAFVSLTDVLTVSLLLAWLFRSMVHQRITIYRSGLETPLIVLISLYVVSTTFAIDPIRALIKTVQVTEWILLLYLALNYTNGEQTFHIVFRTIIGIGLVEVALAVYQVAHEGYFRRVMGTLGNDLGWYMFILMLLVFVHLTRCTKVKDRLFWGGTGVLFLFGFLLTQVRELWVSVLIALFVLGLLEVFVYRRPRRLIRFMLAGTVGASGALLLLLPLMGSYLALLENRGLDTLYTRLGQWGAALSIFAVHPLVGVGPGGFGQVWASFIPQRYYPIVEAYGLLGNPEIDAHSFLFTRLAEIGLLGTAAAVWVLWRLTVLTVQLNKLSLPRTAQSIAITAGVLTLVALLTTFYSDFFQIKLFWLLAGLGLSTRTIASGSVLSKKTMAMQPVVDRRRACNFGH